MMVWSGPKKVFLSFTYHIMTNYIDLRLPPSLLVRLPGVHYWCQSGSHKGIAGRQLFIAKRYPDIILLKSVLNFIVSQNMCNMLSNKYLSIYLPWSIEWKLKRIESK
jgi:hypothetical protein